MSEFWERLNYISNKATTSLYDFKNSAAKALDDQLGALIKPQVPEEILSKYLKFTGYNSHQEFKDSLQGLNDSEIRESYNKINNALFWQNMQELRAINNPLSDPLNPTYYTESELMQKAQDVYDIRNSLKLEHRIATSTLSKAGIALYNYWQYGKFAGPTFQDLYLKKGAIETIISAFKTGGGDLGIKHNVAQEALKMSSELTKAGLPTELTAITETALEAYQNAKLQGSNTFDAWLVAKQYLVTDGATKHYQWLLSSEPLKEKTSSKILDFSFKSIFPFGGQQNLAAKNALAYTQDTKELLSNNPENRPVSMEDCFYMMDKLVFKALDSSQAPVENATEEIKIIRNFVNNNMQDEKLTIDINKFLNHLHHDYENIEQAITKEHLQEYVTLRKDFISAMLLSNLDIHDQELINDAFSKIIAGASQEACAIINNQLHNTISDEAFQELIPVS